jgi:hypothetical protein
MWERHVMADPPDELQSPPISILKGINLRPLPVALAHRMAATQPGDPYLMTLIHLFLGLSFSDRLDFLLEMVRAPVSRA